MILTNPYNYKKLERKATDKGRRYVVKEGRRPLPSVTTVLDQTADKSFLVTWRENVGDEEADRITKQSTDIGNQLHQNLEDYVFSGAKPQGNMLTRIMTDMVIKKGLAKVDEVWGVEVALYIDELYAGTTDLVGVHEGTPAIMDFKNSRKYKKKEWVEDYFLQLAAYGEAHNEMFGTNIDKGVIMMGCHTGHYLEFIIEGDDYQEYVKKWNDRLYMYYEKHGI